MDYEEDDDEECNAETHSWDHFVPGTVDSYWIRCILVGEHEEHEDSHTGLKWKSRK